MFLPARPSVYAVPTCILHLKKCHLLVIFGMSTQKSSVVHINHQSNCDCILVPLPFIRHFSSQRTWHFAEGNSPRLRTRSTHWGQLEIRNSESLANGAIFPLPQNWNFDGMSRYIHYQQWVLLYIIWIIMVNCGPLFCTPEAVSAKTIRWQTQFCLEWQDFIFSGTHIDSDVFKKGILENDSELMN